MDSISHEKVRQYLHLRREGLQAGQRQSLEAHLFVCEDCRRYGRNLTRLERDLSLKDSLDSFPTPVGMGSRVRARLDRASRNRQVFNLAASLVGMLALVGLLAVFFALFSAPRLPAFAPTSISTATARVTIEATAQPSPASGEGTHRDKAPFIAVGQWIAFTSRRDGNEEIYLMKPDGSDPVNLTNHPAADNLPTWSPDGQQLAFISDRSGKPEVYRMGYDGSGLTQLTDLPNVDAFWNLSWSPDGSRLAVEALLTYEVTGELFGRIFLVQADGSGISDLTHNNLPTRVYEPQWSPDGDWIAYTRGGQAPAYVRLVRPDGSEDQAFNRSIRNTQAFAWSPDGSQIAYISSCSYCEVYDNEPADLRLAYLDGSEPETLYRFDRLLLDLYRLSWSPEGSYLAFTVNEGKDSIRHLYLVPAIGGELIDAAAFGTEDWFLATPAWSPDGTHLVLDAGQEQERDIYVLDLEARLREGQGAGVTNLTDDSPGMDYQPRWQP
jgi:Tol biopolymer transport system component